MGGGGGEVCVRMCVRVCLRVCVRARARERVHVCIYCCFSTLLSGNFTSLSVGMDHRQLIFCGFSSVQNGI